MRIFYLKFSLAAALLAAHCASSQTRDDAHFSYENLYQDKYKRGNGGIIPITLESGESYSGTISRDQKYLYFSSNTAGNYDIYLRDLSDVFSIPVVSTVTNQREPSISPDGKRLVYVDDELDPDGDIVVLKVNPKKIIDLYRNRERPSEGWFAARAKNLTNSEKNRIRAKDANPAWSPDGEFIAWSTDLTPQKADDLGAGAGAIQNIWIMPVSNPDAKRQLTQKGGVMPSFSSDGKRIVYISYEDQNSNGAVYEVVIATGKKRRLTSGNHLDFYPSYTPDMKAVILTRIAADSNGDGLIDRKDAGQIIRIEPDGLEQESPLDSLDKSYVEDDEYLELTAHTDHVFDSRVSNFVGGSILLAQLKGEDVNVGFIPLSGAVPIKNDVRQQQQYLYDWMQRAKNKARPCLGLEQLPTAFDASADIEVYHTLSRIRLAACDKEEATLLQEHLADLSGDEKAVYKLFNDLSKISPDYADIKGVLRLESLAETSNAAEYFKTVTTNKSIWNDFHDGDREDPVEYKAILTFIRHEEAKFYIRQGKHKPAFELIRKIIRTNPKYLAIDELLLENGMIDSAVLPAREIIYLLAEEQDAKLLPDYFKGLKSAQIGLREPIRRRAEKFLMEFYARQLTSSEDTTQSEFLANLPEKKHKILHAQYALAAARNALKDEDYDTANSLATQAKKLGAAGSLIQYEANIVFAKIAEARSGSEAAMQLYDGAIRNFHDTEIPTSAKDVIARLATYHDDRAERFHAEQNMRAAATEYQALLELYLSAHANKLTKEIAKGELLDTALNLDQVAMNAANTGGDEKLLKEILEFYDSHIDTARRHLVSEFIFGRGFLRTQLGIGLHVAAEREGLTSSKKEEVFQHFRKAEVDFNWCFFANARFADAYVMLGWMYQFIDEKREVVLDTGTGKRDREIFESLYREYFPDYLFEKNIKLYQKTLALFGKSGSKRVKNSFHLNIANNYFLLNNYSQAEEHYAAILDAKGVPDFQFETPEQEMMYYYHFGRTLYFTGKNEAAARYLQFVENNLNARYPMTAVSTENMKTNQARREIAYKTFALNSEYAQNISAAIQYHLAILSEAKAADTEKTTSLSHLELARLYLKQGDLPSALSHTNDAERLLGKEDNIPIPKFKIRIKWFWIYEPWTTFVGWFYKLPYDDVYIGDNHLAFEIPTVNRYQLLYSIRAEIFKQKGMIQDASDALARLVEYAEKDKTKHGRETLSSAVNRRGELEFHLKNWDSAAKLYGVALAQAEKSQNASAALIFRKNIYICNLRKLESEKMSLDDKIRFAEQNISQVAEFEDDTVKARIKATRKRLKERDDPDKRDLSDDDVAKISAQARVEIQPVLFFKGLNLAHAAELNDFRERYRAPVEEFDQYLVRRKVSFDKNRQALKYFRGFTQEGSTEIDPAFEPDLKNNSLRIKLAMNRAKILQEMNLTDESLAELKEVQDRSQEFRADLEYAIATYRAYRVYESAGLEAKVNLAPYRALLSFFIKNQNFLRLNVDLFERLSNIVIERALRTKNFGEALRYEDLRRQKTATQMYFDDLRFYGAKEEQFSRLLVLEQKRYILAERIRAGRFARQNATVQPLEKELAAAEIEASALKNRLAQNDRLDYRYTTFFSEGYSDAELARLARDGLIYAFKPREEVVFVFAKAVGGRGKIVYEALSADETKSDIERLEAFARSTQAKVIVLAPEILEKVSASKSLQTLAMQTTLRAAMNFASNPDLAKRSLVQFVKSGSFFALTGSNEVRYQSPQPIEEVKTESDIVGLGIHRNIVDYEAQLSQKTTVVDSASLTPSSMFSLKSNPNYAIASLTKTSSLSVSDEFEYATAIDLYFSAMGAGQVLHTFTSRKNAQSAVEAFLAKDAVAPGMVLTGNARLTDALDSKKQLMNSQYASYTAKINAARKLREYTESASYAEDAASLFTNDKSFSLTAAEMYLLAGDTAQASRRLATASVASDSPLHIRKKYAKLLIRSLEYDTAARFIKNDGDLLAAIRQDLAEFEGVSQLALLGGGNLEGFDKAFVWEGTQSVSHRALRSRLPERIKNDELINDICTAATESLEYDLVLRTCLRAANANTSEKFDRRILQAWMQKDAREVKSELQAENQDLFQAVALLQSGYFADSLVYARKFLAKADVSVAEQMLLFSYLRVLAKRQAKEADSAAIAKLLGDYSRAASKNSHSRHNAQANQFLYLLSLASEARNSGAESLEKIDAIAAKSWSSGVQSAYNLLYLTAISVNPKSKPLVAPKPTGFSADAKMDDDLKFFAETDKKYAIENLNCAEQACGLLIKRHLSRGEELKALNLALRIQGESGAVAAKLPEGTFGFVEVFTDEIYEWRAKSKGVEFIRLNGFKPKMLTEVSRGRRYLAYTPRRNLFARLKVAPPRDVVLVDVASSDRIKADKFDSVALASPGTSTLYAALYAEWGSGKKNKRPLKIQIKPPFDSVDGEVNVYTSTLKLDQLSDLKPAAYHLFCADGESYNAFALFAQNVVREMISKKLPIEEAYAEGFKSIKGKQGALKPRYYLYRN